MKLIWSPTEVKQLSEIVDYISEDSPIQAEKWADRILNAVEQLTDYPKSGRIVPEINEEKIREIISGNYRIIYEIEDTCISILTIRHSKRMMDKDKITESDD